MEGGIVRKEKGTDFEMIKTDDEMGRWREWLIQQRVHMSVRERERTGDKENR